MAARNRRDAPAVPVTVRNATIERLVARHGRLLVWLCALAGGARVFASKWNWFHLHGY